MSGQYPVAELDARNSVTDDGLSDYPLAELAFRDVATSSDGSTDPLAAPEPGGVPSGPGPNDNITVAGWSFNPEPDLSDSSGIVINIVSPTPGTQVEVYVLYADDTPYYVSSNTPGGFTNYAKAIKEIVVYDNSEGQTPTPTTVFLRRFLANQT